MNTYPTRFTLTSSPSTLADTLSRSTSTDGVTTNCMASASFPASANESASSVAAGKGRPWKTLRSGRSLQTATAPPPGRRAPATSER